MRMRRPPALALALTLLLAGCGDDDGSTQDGDETFDPPSSTEAPDDGLPDQVVVFGPDDVETDIYGNEVTWTPSADDVAAAEEALQAHIEENPDAGPEPVGDVEGYFRQYTGTGEDGDVVSVNALCTTSDFDWEDDLILVNDGGSCFWQAEYTPTDDTVTSFNVNGQA